MKFIKKLLCVCTVMTVVLSAFAFNALAVEEAGGNANINFSPNRKSENWTYSVGEEITVICTFSPNIQMYSIQAEITFDSTKMQYISGADTVSGNVTKTVTALNGETSCSVSARFKAIASGNAYFRCDCIAANNEKEVHQIGGYTITVKDATNTTSTPTPSNPTPGTSNNANLSAITVTGGTISPNFASNITNYTATVPFESASVTLTAAVADPGATVVGAGTFNVNVGNNKKTITVKAAGGAKKTYTVNIVRLAQGETVSQPEGAGDDALNVTVNGQGKRVMQDITSMPVLEGFSPSSMQFGGVEVGTMKDQNEEFTLCYLTNPDGSDAALYYYDKDKEKFNRLPFVVFNSKTYIFVSPTGSFAPPDGWVQDIFELCGTSVTAFRSESPEMQDVIVVYAYADGEFAFYRYDTASSILQKSPDFVLQPAKAEPLKDSNAISRFAGMTGMGKTVLILLGVAALCIAALAVFVIIKLVRSPEAAPVEFGAYPDEEDDDYFSYDSKKPTADEIPTEKEKL